MPRGEGKMTHRGPFPNVPLCSSPSSLVVLAGGLHTQLVMALASGLSLVVVLAGRCAIAAVLEKSRRGARLHAGHRGRGCYGPHRCPWPGLDSGSHTCQGAAHFSFGTCTRLIRVLAIVFSTETLGVPHRGWHRGSDSWPHGCKGIFIATYPSPVPSGPVLYYVMQKFLLDIKTRV